MMVVAKSSLLPIQLLCKTNWLSLLSRLEMETDHGFNFKTERDRQMFPPPTMTSWCIQQILRRMALGLSFSEMRATQVSFCSI